MRFRKQSISLILAIVLVLSAITACSGSGAGTDGKAANPGADATATAAATDNKGTESASALNIVNGKIEPPVTLTTIRWIDPAATFKNGEDINNNIHYQWAKETLGVEIKNLWTAPSTDNGYETKQKLMLSANEPLPDVFVIRNTDVANQFIESGRVMPVQEAFEKYASKTWKDALAEAPNGWVPFTKNNQRYAIPIVAQPKSSDPVLWIRQDWMDKLNLEPPKSLEDLEKIMDAFVNQDPDGNNKKDTYGIDFDIKNNFNTANIGNISWVFGAYGTLANQWNKDADGKLVYGSIHPGAKQALAKIKEWKDKGYLAEDIALHDSNKVVENLISGKVGIVAGAVWFPTYPGQLLKAKDPNAVLQPYPLPAGPDGHRGRFTTGDHLGAFFFSKDISQESLEAFFHYYNFMYEGTVTEDPFYLRGYQEGYDYIVEDGKPVFDPDKIPGGRVITFKYALPTVTIIYPSKFLQPYSKAARGESLSKSDMATMYGLGLDPWDYLQVDQGKATNIVLDQKEWDSPNYFIGPTTKTQASRNDFLKKMELETFISIIYGKTPLDEFDSFVDKWLSSGGEQITKEVNEWYESVQTQ